MIIAGKKLHIIKSAIGYFKEKGIGQVDLESLQNNLNTLDENNLLPIIERRKDGVFFDGFLYEDFSEFRKEVNDIYEEYEFRQKTNEQKKIRDEQKQLQKKEPRELVSGEISVFPINNVNDAIKYGAGTNWCISKPGSGMCDRFRADDESTFYYVQDGTRSKDDPLSRVIVDMQRNGIVSLTDKNNTTGNIAEFGEDWRKYFRYLENNGVNTSEFVNRPLTQEEIEENKSIGKKIDSLDEFKNLPLNYKFKYINRGYPLTTEQLMSILNLQSVKSNKTKEILINAYLNTGEYIPPIQKVILFENNEGWKATYIRSREIEIDQVIEGYKDDYGKVDYDSLAEYAKELKDNELINKDNLYKDPLKFEEIVVQNLKEFYFLLNKGVSLDQFDWIEISKIPNLPEDFIRKFQNKVDWAWISANQKLSEDFMKEFQDKIVWWSISMNQTLSENFIRKFQNKLFWTYISIHQKLSENFIREFQNKVNWQLISQYQTLSENFIRKFQRKLDWQLISQYQTLSENFIREFQNKVNWWTISERQKLSEDFIKEFRDKVDWIMLSYNIKIPEETKLSLEAQGFPIQLD